MFTFREDGHSAMNNDAYYSTLGYLPEAVKETGGQELILADIMACLHDCDSIWLPFDCPSLAAECENQGIETKHGQPTRLYGAGCGEYRAEFDAIYWGTPTIVNNEALFVHSLPSGDNAQRWTKSWERATSRELRRFAEECGAKRIITGLGTGDISVVERLVDMGGGHVVSYKNFGEFEDWVLVRDLK